MLSIILNSKSSDDDDGVLVRCRCCLPTPGLVVRCLLILLPRLFIDPRNGVIVAADAATANAADLPRGVVRAEEAEADDDDDEGEPLLLSPSRDEDDVAAAF